MADDGMVIFTRYFDFLAWLLQTAERFPRAHRQTLAKRLLDAAFDARERLEAANHRQGEARANQLEEADEALDRVRLYLRLSFHLKWLSKGQYRHASESVAEIGRLLGGWQKATTPHGNSRP